MCASYSFLEGRYDKQSSTMGAMTPDVTGPSVLVPAGPNDPYIGLYTDGDQSP